MNDISGFTLSFTRESVKYEEDILVVLHSKFLTNNYACGSVGHNRLELDFVCSSPAELKNVKSFFSSDNELIVEAKKLGMKFRVWKGDAFDIISDLLKYSYPY